MTSWCVIELKKEAVISDEEAGAVAAVADGEDEDGVAVTVVAAAAAAGVDGVVSGLPVMVAFLGYAIGCQKTQHFV